jgi:hypothetical protein
VTKFSYLGTTLTDQNFIHKEIKSRFNLGNACYYSLQNLLSSHFLSINLKIKLYKTIILLVLCEHEAWSLTPRQDHSLRVFEISMLRRIFGPVRELMEGLGRMHNEEFQNLYTSPIIIRVIK